MVRWDQPINGWELIISSAFGLLVTVVSVWIGIAFALRQERSNRELEAVRRDREITRARIPDFLDRWQSALMPMWFNGAPDLPQDEAPSIYPNWQPGPLRSLLDSMLEWLPPSHRAIHQWLVERTHAFSAYANLAFPTAANSEMRKRYFEFEKESMEPIQGFAAGTISLSSFSADQRDGT